MGTLRLLPGPLSPSRPSSLWTTGRGLHRSPRALNQTLLEPLGLGPLGPNVRDLLTAGAQEVSRIHHHTSGKHGGQQGPPLRMDHPKVTPGNSTP